MKVDNIRQLQNIGKFDNLTAGAFLLLRFVLLYADNGRGKTTLANIMRSAQSGNVQLLKDRHRLGAVHLPRVVLTVDGKNVLFEKWAWSALLDDIAVFDDTFIAQNVCAGQEVNASHRQGLHELIIGQRGVALNTELQGHVERVEEHNRTLREKADKVPAVARNGIDLDAFCDLTHDPLVDESIAETERRIAAAKEEDGVRVTEAFTAFALPTFDVAEIQRVLAQTLPDLQADAANRVRQHLDVLGPKSESWVAEGMRYAQTPQGKDSCPFCAQATGNSPLVAHYQAFFSDAYETHKRHIATHRRALAASHGRDVATAFERAVRVLAERQSFWQRFLDLPAASIDTAALIVLWNGAREGVEKTLASKEQAPLDAKHLPPETLAAINAYSEAREETQQVFASFVGRNPDIAVLKEQTAGANLVALQKDLARLTAIKGRLEPSVIAACDEYLNEKAAKTVTEAHRTEARKALDQYRTNVFPAYEQAMNRYLQRFSAGFRLQSMAGVNARAGSSCTYSVLIDNHSVAVASGDGPSFRTTLSAGDRNALAFSFFLAHLEMAPRLSQMVVVIDDPMTSLDEHRTLTTRSEIKKLAVRVAQLFVFSHSKPFLCGLWDPNSKEQTALQLQRDGNSSRFALWDVRDNCITDNDRRHLEMAQYMRQQGNPDEARNIARALRPMLEAFLRVAYPGKFPPDSMLGQFIQSCNQALVPGVTPILSQADVTELDELREYANLFHHDTNPAWQTETINDQELLLFCNRTLAFARRA